MKIVLILLASSVLVAGGVAASVASVALSQQEPTRTVTVDVAGPGPPGPPGPAGADGVFACGDGYSVGVVTFVEQGKGPTTIKTCLKE